MPEIIKCQDCQNSFIWCTEWEGHEAHRLGWETDITELFLNGKSIWYCPNHIPAGLKEKNENFRNTHLKNHLDV